MVLSGLKPSTPYHLRVTVKDKAGNVSTSDGQVFITNAAKQSAWTLIKDTLVNIFGFWIKGYMS